MTRYTTQPCMLCGESTTIYLSSFDSEGVSKWRAGAYIQDALPTWSPDQRELLMTGTHPACWDLLVPEEDE